MSDYRVLVVDDEDLVREAILDSLPPGFIGIEAFDGLDALGKIPTDRPDVILTDFNMPRMDGCELVRTLYERNVDVPVVMLTGRGSQAVHIDTWVRGIFDYLEKPFAPQSLYRVLDSAVRSRGGMAEESEFRNLSRVVNYEMKISLEKELGESVQAMALQSGLSVSSFIEKILREKIKKG